MNYFVVFQKKTYERESKDGILWAPKKDKNGRNVFHWTNMTKINPGDIVFSIVSNRIVSLNIATSSSYDAIIPAEFSTYGWEVDGWKVNLEYNQISNPIKVTDIIDDLYPLLDKYKSPFQINGKGNQGYLYEVSKLAGDFLLELLSNNNTITIIPTNEAKELQEEFEDIQINTSYGADKEAVVKVRIGHGRFKKELLKIQNCCQLCGLNLLELLVASHIKPWSKSDEFEKVDFNNGLLLCPNHDSLFDKGLISFSDTGELLISSLIDSSTKEKLDLNSTNTLKMNPKKITYISWHRENLFKK